MDVWNGFITGYAEKGPIEGALISAGLAYVQQKVNPMRRKDMEKASVDVNKAFEEWLDTRHEELDGNTPKELILKEREELGNPVKLVKFSMDVMSLAPGEELRKKAEGAVNKAMQLLGENKPKEAIRLYKEHLSIIPRNHVAWLNLGVAHILLSDKKSAEICFRKALEIESNYKVARNNLRILENATEEDIKRMAEEFRIKMVNQGKSRTLHLEDMYDDMYEEIDRSSDL
jgi:tetratricopeptide (TPR) repeat protein